jgi:membrane-bound ClpP family serine protease
MDKTTAILIALGILALAFIAFFAVFRTRGQGKIKGPFGLGMEVKGSNESQAKPGVTLEDAQADGSIRAKDGTGQGVAAKKLKAGNDIELTNSPGNSPPKK